MKKVKRGAKKIRNSGIKWDGKKQKESKIKRKKDKKRQKQAV